MAVSVDTVYQRVLAIANKEQRGFISPVEYNLFANQAQMDIFEQYFYDLNAFHRLPGNETRHSDMVDIIEEKIAIFDRFQQAVTMTGANGLGTLPANYRLSSLHFNTGTRLVEIEHINLQEINNILNSPLTNPTTQRPVYIKRGETAITCYPTADINANVTCDFIARPAQVIWNFTTVSNAPQFNATGAVDFELHASEETELVIKILALAGIEIRQADLYQAAKQEEAQNIQQENK
jgi:hypothetical protein